LWTDAEEENGVGEEELGGSALEESEEALAVALEALGPVLTYSIQMLHALRSF
jgi:hypothetical protein